MGTSDWDEQIEYLMRTRDLYYNDDYLEFLVKSVWRITSPVSMIDFGCGYGYLGLKLMPLLPEGSRYTGLDLGEKLLEKAKTMFNDLPFTAQFIQCDITNYHPDETYDIALCHAFLLHMSDPVQVLSKMTKSLTERGRIICFEPHWISGMSSYFLHGAKSSEIVNLGVLQNLFEKDADRTGKDGNIGIKIPYYLSLLGYKDIDSRVSDKVVFLHPRMEAAEQLKLFESLVTDGVGSAPGDRTEFINGLLNRGLTIAEAEDQYEAELNLHKQFTMRSILTMSSGMKITTGIRD